MTLIDARDWLRRNGEEVAIAATRGDLHAKAVMRYYHIAYIAERSADGRVAERAAANLIQSVHEFIVRDLMIASRRASSRSWGRRSRARF
jgi:hypothetical protein